MYQQITICHTPSYPTPTPITTSTITTITATPTTPTSTTITPTPSNCTWMGYIISEGARGGGVDSGVVAVECVEGRAVLDGGGWRP